MRHLTRALRADLLVFPLIGLALAGCTQSDNAIETRAQPPGSLPAVASGVRPGPEVLYRGPVDAPQLQNLPPWKAEPILISGASAYRDGEYLHQDFLYDDHGALGAPDPNSPMDVGAFLFSPVSGSYTYPTDPAFANNAADIVEFRVKPLPQATAFRVTLNSLLDPERVAFTFALGDSAAAVNWPHAAGVKSPAAQFLTVHGTQVELLDAATLQARGAPTVVVDLERRQFTITVPHKTWDPGTSQVRMTLGVGLWDTAAGSYLAPSPQSATATTPGGAAPTLAAIVNVAPRFNEPWPDVSEVPTQTIGDSAVGSKVQGRWWREKAQADALQLGDVSAFFDTVDFAKLAAGASDESRVPRDGPMDRIFASRYVFGQGHDPSKLCYELGSFDAGSACIGRFVGQLQPYALYVPPGKPQPARGWGLALMPHSLSANYNQYAASKNQSQVGDQGAGYIVLTPAGRGPDGWNSGVAEADDFEAWADVARHYALDPSRTVVTGYSMGGYGTYRMIARWPDLFAAGFSVVGIPGVADPMLPGLRNVPLMMWNAVADELVNVRSAENAATRLTDLGLRFTYWLFPTADHLTLATNDEYAPGAAFLDGFTVDPDPPHVSFVVNPAQDSSGVVADHAYWLSGIQVRDAEAGVGSIDVRSEGFGVGDAPVLDVVEGAGVLVGGAKPLGYVSRQLPWGEAPVAPVADALTITATNVASVTIDAARARVSCKARLDVNSDGPLDVKLEGCGR